MEELQGKQRGRLWLRLGIRLVITIVCLLVLLLAAPPLFSLFAPFILAFFTAWLLNPAVRFFQKRVGGSRRLWSLALLLGILVLLSGSLAALLYNLFLEFRQLVNNWQSIWAEALVLLEAVQSWWERLFPHLPAEVTAWLETLATRALTWARDSLPAMLSVLASGAGAFAVKVPSFCLAAVIFIMGSYFVIADYPHIRYLALHRLSSDTVGLLRFIKHTASAAFGGYVRAQLILSVVVFFILLTGFTITGRSYALLLALVLAVMDFIPIIGSGTVMVPWAVLCLFTHEMRTAVELIVIWGIILLFRRIAEPKVVGNQTGLSPILSLVSIYVGMKVGGVAGMILGPVVLLVVLNVCKAGVFDNTAADIALAIRDTRAILKNRS